MFNKVKSTFFHPLLLIVPLTLLTTSCSLFTAIFDPKPIEELQCQLPSVGYVDTNKSDKLEISVNVDGSGSMIGYVSVNNSNYIDALDAIENVIDPNSTTTVEYKRIGRIGDKVNQVISRNDFRRDAKSKVFYDGISNPEKYPPVSSPIHEAIEPASQGIDKLTVIITDLEGDDGDLISQRLRKYYFNQQLRDQGYTVGVWAVKSQFQGYVFDPKTGKARFYYNTETEGKSRKDYRPFYVLFIGKYAEIAHYFDQIKNLYSQLIDDSEMFIFPASNIVKQAINLGTFNTLEKTVELPDNNQLDRLVALEDDNVIVRTENNDVPYELLEIIHEDEKTIELNYQVPFPLLTENDEGGIYALNVDDGNLSLKTRVFTFSQNKTSSSNIQTAQTQVENENSETENQQPENEPLNQNNYQKDPEIKEFFQENSSVTLKNGLTIENLALINDNQTLEFTTNINIDNLSNSQIYLFEVDLILDNMKDLVWWQNWDSRNANNQDGSKTQNISLFMKKLEQLSLDSIRDENNHAVIGRLCFAIHKN